MKHIREMGQEGPSTSEAFDKYITYLHAGLGYAGLTLNQVDSLEIIKSPLLDSSANKPEVAVTLPENSPSHAPTTNAHELPATT